MQYLLLVSRRGFLLRLADAEGGKATSRVSRANGLEIPRPAQLAWHSKAATASHPVRQQGHGRCGVGSRELSPEGEEGAGDLRPSGRSRTLLMMCGGCAWGLVLLAAVTVYLGACAYKAEVPDGKKLLNISGRGSPSSWPVCAHARMCVLLHIVCMSRRARGAAHTL